ncbi:HNH endonuclease signature motif containing protein [Parafrigoribacterium soli]|uniref:HNH endonuclease signature motif containing protein n=1 Tax=Parafrigoribacterium soli TaxID=3144663 RepID=UPI0032EACCE9
MARFTDSLAAMAAAAAALPRDSVTLAALSDEELLGMSEALADIGRRVGPSAAAVAGEIARRSTRQHGFDGLAQRTGFRTPEHLVQSLTGSTSREAGRLVRTGLIIHEAELVTTCEKTGEVPPELTRPWLVTVGQAIAAGNISIDAAEAIRAGLGEPGEHISADALAEAATSLVDTATRHVDDTASAGGTAGTLNADQLLIRARALRDDLDEVGIADRERARRQARSFRRFRRPDGMTAYRLLADPENAAYLDGIYDALTSPRRGGPRMVDLSDTTRNHAIEADPRTLEQLAFDGIMAVLRIGASTDEKTAARNVLGSRRPAVRMLVTRSTLESGTGHGRIEGQHAPVSIETIDRAVCTSGVVPVVFDSDGQCVDLGREQRLYTARQRIGLAARDGGCRWPDCDRPASWSEAHHINHWARDHGETNIADGILLCRYHHLLEERSSSRPATRTTPTHWVERIERST